MTYFKLLFLLFFSPFAPLPSSTQDLVYEFANAKNSPDSSYYEVEVSLASNAPFYLGSGQLYINYNEAAFGSNVIANQSLEVLHPPGSILADLSNTGETVFPIRVVNDNANGRFSFAWASELAAGCLPEPNMMDSARMLCQFRINYAPGGFGEMPSLCFETLAPFDDQTGTMCGPWNTCAPEDCINFPGAIISSDVFDCSGAIIIPTNEAEAMEPPSCHIFPNPTTGDIFIELFLTQEEPIRLRLVSAHGALLTESEWQPTNGLNRRQLQLPEGWKNQLLFLTLENKHFAITKPVLFSE